MKTSFLLLFLPGFYLQALEPLHDNLPAIDGSTHEYVMTRPSLFGESTRKSFVRRDRISDQVSVTFLSTTGKSLFKSAASSEAQARQALANTNFESVSGKEKVNIPTPTVFKRYRTDPDKIDFNTAALLGEAAGNIYLKFPEAAKKFSRMGFTEQHYIAGLQTDTEGVVVKNQEAIVIAYRGTESSEIKDWMTDLKFAQVPLLKGNPLRVHLGFYQALNEVWPFIRSEIVSTLENKIRKLVKSLTPLEKAAYGISGKVSDADEREIYITGFSLGAALATLSYGELTLNWLDSSNQGYYFVDPTLAQLSDEKISQLIKDTIEKESSEGREKRSFSLAEEDAIAASGSLAYLAVIQNEASYSTTPVADQPDLVIDRRLAALNTFGCPRSGDWLYKYALEKYASATGSKIIRFENLSERSGIIGNIIKGDLVPRVPLSNLGAGLIMPDYTHVGVRVFFESDEREVNGDAHILKCEYTNKAREFGLSEKFNGLKFSFGYHDMSLYLARVQSYLDHHTLLDSTHSCSTLKYSRPE